MRTISRRSVLAALGITLPIGVGAAVQAAPETPGTAPTLRFRPFEDALRRALSARAGSADSGVCVRVEVGHSDQLQAGVQGCHNARPFAGFPAGHLRIVRAGTEPGPVRQGVRLYISTVDVVLTDEVVAGTPSRSLDFATLPPAPTFA